MIVVMAITNIINRIAIIMISVPTTPGSCTYYSSVAAPPWWQRCSPRRANTTCKRLSKVRLTNIKKNVDKYKKNIKKYKTDQLKWPRFELDTFHILSEGTMSHKSLPTRGWKHCWGDHNSSIHSYFRTKTKLFYGICYNMRKIDHPMHIGSSRLIKKLLASGSLGTAF